MDEGRQTHRLYKREAGKRFQGPQFIGSLTLSVDMSKAFDMVEKGSGGHTTSSRTG